MKFFIVRGSTILEHNALNPTVICLTHSCVNANLGSHSTHQQSLDTLVLQQQLQISLIECPFSWLVNNSLTTILKRLQLRDNVVPDFASDQDSSIWAICAYGFPVFCFDSCDISEIRSVSLASVDDSHTGITGGCQDFFCGFNGTAQQRNIIPKPLPKSALAQEISLEVDKDQGCLITLHTDNATWICVELQLQRLDVQRRCTGAGATCCSFLPSNCKMLC
mmetsp:Transcript_7941/g.16820  ORF Transcript_7941/g.16820 Transcript_7941/m.16820 type:complete len:221 (-) Transcript_7941:742-1404(-)